VAGSTNNHNFNKQPVVSSTYSPKVIDLNKNYCKFCKVAGNLTFECRNRIKYEEKLVGKQREARKSTSGDYAHMTVEDAPEGPLREHYTVGCSAPQFRGNDTFVDGTGKVLFDNNTILNEFIKINNCLCHEDFSRFGKTECERRLRQLKTDYSEICTSDEVFMAEETVCTEYYYY
jgi:hypothetical protein